MRNLLVVLAAAFMLAPNSFPSSSSYTRLEQGGSGMSQSGDWYAVKRGYCSGGAAISAMVMGESVTFTFTGSGMRWIGYKDEWAGIANVYLDGKFQASVDTYASPSVSQTPVWETSGLRPAAHTVTIVVQGTQNPSSRGSWVWVDAFDVIP